MTRPWAILLLSAMALSVRPLPASAQVPPPRERIGIRFGYVESTGSLDKRFGDGNNLAFHFDQIVYDNLYVDVRIGALNWGDLIDAEFEQELKKESGLSQVEMRFLFLSGGPKVSYNWGGNSTAYGSVGIGIYSVSITLAANFFGVDTTSDQRFGMNGSVGWLYRVTTNWNVDFNFTAHRVWTSPDVTDLFFIYTGSSDPLVYQFALGAVMDLR